MGRKYSTRKSRRVIKRSLRKANKRRTYKRRTYKRRTYKTRKYKTRKNKTRKNKYKGGVIDPKLSNPELWEEGEFIGEGDWGYVLSCTYNFGKAPSIANPDGTYTTITPDGHVEGKKYAMKITLRTSGIENEYNLHNRVDKSPHIPTLYAKWEDNKQDEEGGIQAVDIIVMEFIRGNTLSVYMKGLLESDVRDLFKQLCIAVSTCHGEKIYHRDLTGYNVIVSRDADGKPFVYLIDFGAADVDESSRTLDIYELGLVLMHLVLGKGALYEVIVTALENNSDKDSILSSLNDGYRLSYLDPKVLQQVITELKNTDCPSLTMKDAEKIDTLEYTIKNSESWMTSTEDKKEQIKEITNRSRVKEKLSGNLVDLFEQLVTSPTLTMDKVLEHPWFITV